jgi:hypothetical protein
MLSRYCSCVIILACAQFSGCGPSGPATYPVSGSVTFEGKPLENGTVVFDPADGKGKAAMGNIVSGQLIAKVPAGEKILRFSAIRNTEEKDQYGGTVTVSVLPDKFNSGSKILRTVSVDGENKFDIILE